MISAAVTQCSTIAVLPYRSGPPRAADRSIPFIVVTIGG
jgi:hypothetical protein